MTASRASLMFHSPSSRHNREEVALDPSQLVESAASLMDKRVTDPREVYFAMKAVYPRLLRKIEVRYDRRVEDVSPLKWRLVCSKGFWARHVWDGCSTSRARACPNNLAFRHGSQIGQLNKPHCKITNLFIELLVIPHLLAGSRPIIVAFIC
jgi:hypothetical protein